MEPKRQKLTNSSDEASVSDLISGDLVFSIPYFQRPYRWEPKRLKQLNEDILTVVDERADSHFLGAIIIYGRPSNPSDPKVYEVIDGQQRLTTIFLSLCALVRTFCEHGEHDEAASLFLKYLVISRNTTLITNSKLQSCKDDRSQLNFVFSHLMRDSKFVEKVAPFKFIPLPATGAETGRLRNNYKASLRFLADQVQNEGIDRLKEIYRALVEYMSFVQIDVWDPTNGPKIFDSLNSQQQPMTTGDLVRNEIFSKVSGKSPDEIEVIDRTTWQPFYQKFVLGSHSLFDDYFFPYALTLDPNLKKSEIYSYLRESWKKIDDPASIVSELAVYQDAFLDLKEKSNLKQLDTQTAIRVKRIAEITPTSTFPFLMQLINAMSDKRMSADEGGAVLDVIESFLVRRAIVGHEPTGLHAVFKRLWADCGNEVTAQNVANIIREHKTVAWPTSTETKRAISERPVYGSAITPFILAEWNRSFGGDVVSVPFWIEHILPEKANEGWEAFSKDQHEKMKNRLANLLPLTQQMNQELSNGPYKKKRSVYEKDSCFKATREFAKTNSEWTPKSIEDRSEVLCKWFIERWKY